MEKRPNILFIVMDSVRASNLSCYGYHRPTTPNLDKFAAEGVLFEQAISEGCWTLPVHTSLFTGLYPSHHGVTISKSALPENVPTLASLLSDHGYQTCCFSNNAYISEASGLARGFQTMEDVWRIVNPRGIKRTPLSRLIVQLRKLGRAGEPLIALVRFVRRVRKIVKGGRNTRDKGADLTNKMIRQWLSESWQKDKPFFMFVNYMECHEKYNPPQPYDRKFMPEKYSHWRVLQVGTDKAHILKASEKRKREDLEILTALYDGEINYLDHKIGELLQHLEQQGLADDTVVVITSDHGDSLGEHDAIGHRMVLYEQLIHVPLLVRYRKHFKPGTRVPEPVQLSDLYPTFLELAGVGLDKAESNGFVSLLQLDRLRERPYTVSENTAPRSLDGLEMRALRTRRYKLIWKANGEHELYDLEQDAGETRNLYQAETKTAEKLLRWMEQWQQQHAGQKLEAREAEHDEALAARLRALGYMN